MTDMPVLTRCAHEPGAVCWLCSDQVHWWRAARIAAGYGAEPPNAPARRCERCGRRAIQGRTICALHLRRLPLGMRYG